MIRDRNLVNKFSNLIKRICNFMTDILFQLLSRCKGTVQFRLGFLPGRLQPTAGENRNEQPQSTYSMLLLWLYCCSVESSLSTGTESIRATEICCHKNVTKYS